MNHKFFYTFSFVFILTIILVNSSNAATEHVVGAFSARNFKGTKVACDSRPIKSIKLISGHPSSCSGEIEIRSAAITYDGGFKQNFDYAGGAILTSTEFNVLPKTQCIAKISADLDVINEPQKKCLDQHQIQVIVERI